MRIGIGLTVLIVALLGCSGNRMDAKMEDIKVDFERHSDYVNFGDDYEARIKVWNETNLDENWLVNISYPRRVNVGRNDTLEFIQLSRQDSLGYYLMSVSVNNPGVYRFLIMGECCEGGLAQQMVTWPDTLSFIYLPKDDSLNSRRTKRKPNNL